MAGPAQQASAGVVCICTVHAAAARAVIARVDRTVFEQIVRLEPLIEAARSLAALTPGGMANVAGLALADNLERDLTWLRTLAAEVEGE